jgi:hypothetical protein
MWGGSPEPPFADGAVFVYSQVAIVLQWLTESCPSGSGDPAPHEE